MTSPGITICMIQSVGGDAGRDAVCDDAGGLRAWAQSPVQLTLRSYRLTWNLLDFPTTIDSARCISIPARRPLADREGPMIRLVLASVIGLMTVLGFGRSSATAQPESCPQHFVGGTPPTLLKPQLAQG